MKRIIMTVIAGAVMTAVSAPTAFSDCPNPGGGFPEGDGWYAVDKTFTIPKGAGCNVKITVQLVGHQRDTFSEGADAEHPEPGDTLLGESPDMQMTVTNTKTHKKINKPVTGSIRYTVKKNGRDLKAVGRGSNVYFGRGINGVIWADGVQHKTVRNAFSAEINVPIQRIDKTKGKTVELCRKIGARAVPGKNLGPDDIVSNLP